ncbi:hypothetical protein F4553_002051 [Allocatelliglobosispora scoriae]|uniref:HD domain-containing protein n=1 Tax=Allocatelliglobosispora scoriae TaxID=643052 RepID=A0A841BPK0_9ACTN|nr:metal-dependent phosphohydrolase [Allocatelliglobosispora scoriae]MBB5868672.1 hypothetical protein [Allocatelliglobosispora scoriae]
MTTALLPDPARPTGVTVLNKPRHPIVERALRLSRLYYEGHVINEAPALNHAMRVAITLVEHEPDASPVMIASALLQDMPIYAPATVDVDIVLRDSVAEGVGPIVRGLAIEQDAMMSGKAARLASRSVMLIMAADRIVALRTLLERARSAPDQREFWIQRQRLRGMFEHFRAWYALAEPVLPVSMAIELSGVLRDLEMAALGRDAAPREAAPVREAVLSS